MGFFPKCTRNSTMTVLTIVSTTLITTIGNTNLNDTSEYSSFPSTWSIVTSLQKAKPKLVSNSTEQVADSDGSVGKDVEIEAQAESLINSTAQTVHSNSSFEKDTDKETKAESQNNTTESTNSNKSAKKEVEVLLKSLHEMKQNRDEINTLYLRSLAENENLAKRCQKQIEEAKTFGIQSFSKDLLEIADVLQKAIESIPKEEITDNNPYLKNLYEGLSVVEYELKTVFTRHGLEVFNPLNEKFDANFHEALFEQEIEGKPPGIVFVVSKQGYKLHGRVIRPALVGVTK